MTWVPCLLARSSRHLSFNTKICSSVTNKKVRRMYRNYITRKGDRKEGVRGQGRKGTGKKDGQKVEIRKV